MSVIGTPITLLGDTIIGTPTDTPVERPGGTGSVISQLAAINVALDRLRVEVRETNALLLRLILNFNQANSSPGGQTGGLSSVGGL